MGSKRLPYNPAIPEGYCQCGCGQKTSRVKVNLPSSGYKKGEFRRFVQYHNLKLMWRKGSGCLNWKGGKGKHSEGYVLIYNPNHPRAIRCYVPEQVLVAEQVLGKHLPKQAVVHHVNGNRQDNRKENLVVCENKSYHMLLHQRQKALKESGHAGWYKCKYCHQYDKPENLKRTSRRGHYHPNCRQEYRKNRRALLND